MTDSLFNELLASLEDLPLSENYSNKDRYADFRQLFTGSEQGKRVYRELLSWGRMFNAGNYGNAIDGVDMLRKMAMSEGQRSYAIKLMAAINIEPLEQPKKARKKL